MNNQIYNIISHTSFLNSRAVRLSLLYLAIVLEFSLNALFYNVREDNEEADTRLFWKVTVENFWVAVYSALIAMLFLLAVALMLRVPSKWIK